MAIRLNTQFDCELSLQSISLYTPHAYERKAVFLIIKFIHTKYIPIHATAARTIAVQQSPSYRTTERSSPLPFIYKISFIQFETIIRSHSIYMPAPAAA